MPSYGVGVARDAGDAKAEVAFTRKKSLKNNTLDQLESVAPDTANDEPETWT